MEAIPHLEFPHPRHFNWTDKSSHHLWKMRQKDNTGPSWELCLIVLPKPSVGSYRNVYALHRFYTSRYILICFSIFTFTA